jgi:subtilisin family serine protease
LKRVLTLLCLSLTLCGSASANLLIARLKAGVTPEAMVAKYGITLEDRAYKAPFYLFSVPGGEDELHRVQGAMVTGGDAFWVEDDSELEMPESERLRGSLGKGSVLPAVGERRALYEANTNMLGQINFSRNLADSAGREVRVAILDTGLSSRVKYLWPKVIGAMNFIEDGTRPYDLPMGVDTNGNGIKDEGAGHGTMVAGLIDQIAPQTKLVIARVANSDGVSSSWNLIEGLSYAVAMRCEVANVSLGTLGDVKAVEDVIAWCEQKRLTVVAAIGNDGVRDACEPARFDKVICVGGLLPDNRKAPFSNWRGTCDVSAPATGIASAWWDGKLATWSGTSFSTPMVTAVIADSLRRTTKLAPWEIRPRIRNAGMNLNALNPEYDDELGTLLDHVRFDARLRATLP